MKWIKCHAYVVIVFICICMLDGCKDEEPIIVNIPTATPAPVDNKVNNDIALPTDIPLDESDSITLSNDSATKYIHYVNTECTEFWSVIESNPIDVWYNENVVRDNSSRLICKANEEYFDKWQAEALVTYSQLSQLLSIEERVALSKQWESFWKFIDNTDSIYSIFVNKENEYGIPTTKEIKTACSFEKADKAREYTIELKEYIYLLGGEVLFSDNFNNNEKVVSDNTKQSTISTFSDVHSGLIQNDVVKDIIRDSYTDKIEEYKTISGKKSKRISNCKEFSQLWSSNMGQAYDYCLQIMNDTDRMQLLSQYEEWTEYMNSSSSFAKIVFGKTSSYSTIVSNDNKPDLDVIRGNCSAEYFFEVLQYMYIIEGKIDI